MDQMVLETQKWLNTTYKERYGYKGVPEDGHTGWPTIYSLTRALQLELGISEPADNFGPTTARLFEELSINSNPNESDKSPKALNTRRKIKILQGALWCKGYNPGGFTGFFGANTEKAIRSLQADAGLPTVNGVVDATVMKALLSMDAFTLLNYGSYNGDAKIREIQQALNRKYSNNIFFKEDIGLVPCDGIYERKTNKALIYALQIEEGISEPTGYFGPGTRSNCPYLTLGTENQFVTLLQYALYCNGKDFDPTGFTGYYGNGTRGAVLRFQQFTGLSNSGNAGMQTWSSLLTSVGDPTRQGTACDCSTTITKEKAQTIVNSGYKIVGRYLTGRFKLTAEEFKTIIDAGLSLIPIFEVNGYEASWFNATNGAADAISALNAASELGIPNNAIIYFAVDYDVSGYELENNIAPYFKAIKDIFTKNNNPYKIGIYAPRQVCSTMSQKGYTCSSFVCDMSTGFACNLGYSLPKDWAFDQISTISIGSDDGFIEIDNNIARGTDNGCNHIVDTKNKSEKANKNPLCKLLNIQFEVGEPEVELFNSKSINIKASLTSAINSSDSDFTISVKKGKLFSTEAPIMSALSNIMLKLSPEDGIEFSTKLGEIGDFEFNGSCSINSSKLCIGVEVPNSQDIPYGISSQGAVGLTIEIKLPDKDDIDSFKKRLKEELIELNGFLQDILKFILFAIIIILAIATFAEGSLAAITVAFVTAIEGILLKFLSKM